MVGDKETMAVYDAQAEEYARLTESDARDRQLDAFIADIATGGHVMDLGCGPGHLAAVMATAGLQVTAVDASAEMVRLANAQMGVDARQATFDDLSGEDIYDGIWANFSLLHAPRNDMPRHLAALARALKPGGRFHIALKTGTGEKRDRLGRFYTYYSVEELTGLVEAAGMRVTKTVTGRSLGLDGTPADWVGLAAHG